MEPAASRQQGNAGAEAALPLPALPHPHQKAVLARAFGRARVVWNDALALC
ncbi:helix-turn-helix domain-containing protein [Candidatus Synechococcus spongiarum]|uniref:helix-turn-helix domain-containing protein n=1 Tax=Candidatus Synechococcus spongiarum TaxID=431041 RepID=UPI0034D54587